MTKNEEKRIIEIYGSNYEETDIPTFIRNREEREYSRQEDLRSKYKDWDLSEV